MKKVLTKVVTEHEVYETSSQNIESYDGLDDKNSDHSDVEEQDFFGRSQMNEWKDKRFSQLWLQMAPIDSADLIRKTVLAKSEGLPISDKMSVKVRYSAFYEGSSTPFTCTVNTLTTTIHVGKGEVPIGVEIALKSMRLGESSRFLISFKLMYGEFGLQHLVPPKADFLYNICIMELVPVIEDRSNLKEENSFKVPYEKAVALHLTGKKYFEKKEYKYAAKAFKSAVYLMDKTRLRDEEEEIQWKNFLGKLYCNLAICYNFLKLPYKACCMCNALHSLGKLHNNSKALFHNGRALMMIGQYKFAEKQLRRASQLDPNCPNIKSELLLLEQKKTMHDIYQNQMAQKLNHSLISNRQNLSPSTKVSEQFTEAIEEFCTSLLKEAEVFKAMLPSGLNEMESNEVKRVVKKHNLFCDEENDVVTLVSKMSLKDYLEVDEKKSENDIEK